MTRNEAVERAHANGDRCKSCLYYRPKVEDPILWCSLETYLEHVNGDHYTYYSYDVCAAGDDPAYYEYERGRSKLLEVATLTCHAYARGPQ